MHKKYFLGPVLIYRAFFYPGQFIGLTSSNLGQEQTKNKQMTIYGLKGLIKALELENNPSNKYLIQFYNSLYQEQLQMIADKVKKQLDQDNFYKSKNWNEYLAK